MRTLGFRRAAPAGAMRDPAPSRWGYRYQRLMLTPAFRATLRVGLPICLLLVIAGYWLAQADNRARLAATVEGIKVSVQERPEFMVAGLAVDGADDALVEEIRAALDIAFPVSSFAFDLVAMRETVEALPPVRRATLRVRPGGILGVDVDQRIPVAFWRRTDGLHLIDAEGVLIGTAAGRTERPDLPVLAGDKADAAIGEAMAVLAAAGPVASRVRGLVRTGERRWDLVLDRDQRILLPAEGAVAALERVIALEQAQRMLERDVAVVDMRLAARPTIRLNAAAHAQLRGIAPTTTGAEN